MPGPSLGIPDSEPGGGQAFSSPVKLLVWGSHLENHWSLPSRIKDLGTAQSAKEYRCGLCTILKNQLRPLRTSWEDWPYLCTETSLRPSPPRPPHPMGEDRVACGRWGGGLVEGATTMAQFGNLRNLCQSSASRLWLVQHQEPCGNEAAQRLLAKWFPS